MPVAVARKVAEISQAQDPKRGIQDAVGDLGEVEIYFNHILVGTYIRPEKSSGGIILTGKTLDEDTYQGKVGLVLKKGPQAFVDDAEVSFDGQDIEVGEWAVYRVGDGWDVTVNGTPCRMLTDRHIRMRIKNPKVIF